MAARLAQSGLRAARMSLRPKLPVSAMPLKAARFQSNVPQPDPKSKAQAILDSLPGNSNTSKTAILAGGAGLSIAAISNEVYVVTEETVVMASFFTVVWAIYHYMGPMYKQWAEGHTDKIRSVLDTTREEHKTSVEHRIENVKSVAGVVDVTKDLFAVSKETAQLESQAYELEQRQALATEAKSVLDSWVRYEGQLKQRQQRELAESVIAKVEKELENPRVLKQILDQSVADVEKIVSQRAS